MPRSSFCWAAVPFSVDTLLGRELPVLRGYAVPLLRIFMGVEPAWTGFSEKPWNLDMALAFLAEHQFNFFPALAFPAITDEVFAIGAGVIGVTVGVLHISGLFLRLVVAVLWFPLNLTLPFLGMVELLGHMPIYATIVILFIFGSGRSEPVPAEQVHGG